MAADPLDSYRRKRRFDRTPEPEARSGRTPEGGRLTYAIQKHDARRLHYDLRLEWAGVLKSWAITRGPSLDPRQKRLAVRTEDHPLAYAGFEGQIPAGQYGAGEVVLWDRGHWEPVGDAEDGLAAGRLDFILHGERLHGRFVLVRMKPAAKAGRAPEKAENWLLIKRDDADADPTGEVTRRHPGSVAVQPKREAAPLPGFVAPMLATLTDRPPRGPGWVFEIKLDGYRALAAVSGGRAVIRTRSGLDWTDRFPGIARALAARPGLDGVLLDGEVTAMTADGRTDFSALQAALSAGGEGLHYGVFDLLAEGGQSLRHLPWTARKARLRALMGTAAGDGIHVVDHSPGPAGDLLDQVCAAGHEGLIAKRADAPYRPGRGHAWLKVKCGQAGEYVVVGTSPSEAGRPFASLLLAVQDRGTCRYAGRVGAGFSDRDFAWLAPRLTALARKTPPVDRDSVPPAVARAARWVEPRIVVQVAHGGLTGEGLIRQGRYLGPREDKPAAEVEADRVMAVEEAEAMDETGDSLRGVRLTHPDRVLFPEQGITKRDLARWFDAVAALMMPHLQDRLVSLVRCPEGRRKACFFQRHAGRGLPRGFASRRLTDIQGNTEEYVLVRDPEGLVGAAQIGVLELHLWGSRIDRPERPDRLVFDLDPDPAVDFAAVRQAAFDMRDALAALDLASVPLLTGGKGVHVVVPIARRHDWPVVKAAAKALAQRFADHDPDRFVATMSKAKRKGRIFIDHFRNDRTATAICPWSPRARAGAPVARPVDWQMLAGIDRADAFRLGDPLPATDPWAGLVPPRQGLTTAALRALGVAE
ncbi:DNA ligase D [Tistrella mobilis]|uniref:DNA ligase D n=1 Tax=Tistrella mobilis TaxID=171437 RepID=UPI0035573922